MGSLVLGRDLNCLRQVLRGFMETILKQITVAEVVEQTWVLWTLLQGLFVVEFSDLPLFPQVSDNSQTMVGGRIRRVT